MKKETAIVCSLVIVSSILGCTGGDYGDYNREIERDYDSEDEEKALDIVENYNYSALFDIERFVDDDWASYIDTQVIDYYNEEFERMRDEGAEHDVELIYKAEVFTLKGMSLVYDHIPDRDEYSLKVHADGDVIVEVRGEVLPRIIAVFNGEDLTLKDVDEEFEKDMSEVYLVNLELEFSDVWGPKAAIGTHIYQVVALDKEFKPGFIFIDPEQWIS